LRMMPVALLALSAQLVAKELALARGWGAKLRRLGPDLAALPKVRGALAWAVRAVSRCLPG
jgi:hypothetical protein